MQLARLAALAALAGIIACGEDDKPKPQPKPQPRPEPQPAPEPEKPGWPDFPIPIPPGFPMPPGWPLPTPGPGPQPVPPEKPSEPSGDQEQALLSEINKARASRGLGAVVATDGLNCAAQRHAKDIGVKRICGHTGSDGSSPWDRAGSCGAQADGEIVACGQGSPESAVQAWTMSPGHAAIMYDRNQSKVGVAMLNNYWVAIFM